MWKSRWNYRKRVTVILVAISSFMLFGILFNLHVIHLQNLQTEFLFRVLGTRNTSEFVKPHVNTILVDGTDLTTGALQYEVESDKGVFIFRPTATNGHDEKTIGGRATNLLAVIVVLSEVGKDANRQAIRDTWYRWMNREEIRVVFFLGSSQNATAMKAVAEEINAYHDIIVDDFLEEYYLLTVKVLRMLKWFVNTFPVEGGRPAYLVKTDHDVFNNVPNLVKHLREVEHVKGYIGGRLHTNPIVSRSVFSKWYTPYELWEREEFPAYVGGPCYFLSGSVVPLLYETGLKEPLFHLEDVFLTGLVANVKLKLTLYDAGRTRLPQSAKEVRVFREFIGDGLAYHPMTTEDMKDYYRILGGT